MIRILAFSLAVVVTLSTSAPAQERKPEERDVRKGYIVEVIGEGGKVVETVGAFLSSEDADKAEKQWNANHPTTLLLTRVREGDVEVKRQPPRTSRSSNPSAPAAGPKDSTIVMPSLKVVDPGSLKKGEVKVRSLAGKKGSGTIGKQKVTIEFTGEGGIGEFATTGNLKVKGTWRQLGKFVLMETEWMKCDGTLDGNKVTGTLRLKNGGEKDVWSVTLTEGADAGGQTKAQRSNKLSKNRGR